MGAIIWLASYPKSGNTWLRAFLFNLLRNPPRPASINELDHFCLGESSGGWYARRAGRPIAGMEMKELMALRPQVHRDFTKAFPDSVFVKTHNFMGECCDVPLHTMEVTAGAIYVVRNPLDVVISMSDHFGVDLDAAIARLGDPLAATEITEEHAAEFHAGWSTHVSSWTAEPSASLHIIRYEDMLDRPNRTFRGVATFLGLTPPIDRLRKAIRFSSFDTLRAQEREAGFRERSQYSQAFFRSGRKQQWRVILSSEQIERVVRDHGEQMERFNYLP
ncbi:MAG: sulfotransferase domain-containing protein [Alphaproteobacteria bacterium]|nr:sulfotransferase domain-containing protein [Alphaproteobacteria bacterium]